MSQEISEDNLIIDGVDLAPAVEDKEQTGLIGTGTKAIHLFYAAIFAYDRACKERDGAYPSSKKLSNAIKDLSNALGLGRPDDELHLLNRVYQSRLGISGSSYDINSALKKIIFDAAARQTKAPEARAQIVNERNRVFSLLDDPSEIKNRAIPSGHVESCREYIKGAVFDLDRENILKRIAEMQESDYFVAILHASLNAARICKNPNLNAYTENIVRVFGELVTFHKQAILKAANIKDDEAQVHSNDPYWIINTFVDAVCAAHKVASYQERAAVDSANREYSAKIALLFVGAMRGEVPTERHKEALAKLEQEFLADFMKEGRSEDICQWIEESVRYLTAECGKKLDMLNNPRLFADEIIAKIGDAVGESKKTGQPDELANALITIIAEEKALIVRFADFLRTIVGEDQLCSEIPLNTPGGVICALAVLATGNDYKTKAFALSLELSNNYASNEIVNTAYATMRALIGEHVAALPSHSLGLGKARETQTEILAQSVSLLPEEAQGQACSIIAKFYEWEWIFTSMAENPHVNLGIEMERKCTKALAQGKTALDIKGLFDERVGEIQRRFVETNLIADITPDKVTELLYELAARFELKFANAKKFIASVRGDLQMLTPWAQEWQLEKNCGPYLISRRDEIINELGGSKKILDTPAKIARFIVRSLTTDPTSN